MTTPVKPPNPILFYSFIALMSALILVFIWLGVWQLQRLDEKETLVTLVESRLDQPPIPLPESTAWTEPLALDFQPVGLTGRFRHAEAIRVFTSLSSSTARGTASGPGYWIVTPFALDTGGTVFVNRGFVPQQMSEFFIDDPEGPTGTQALTGLVRPPETAGAFIPQANTADRIEWVRDPARLAALVPPDLAPIAPFTIDLPAGAPGDLPQGGETVIEFPNNHFGYALTWFGFALITPVMLGFWIVRQRRPAGPQGP